MDRSRQYPDASQVDQTDPAARLAYFFAVAGYLGSFNYGDFLVSKGSCIEIVCGNFDRMGETSVNDARFHYTLESAIWKDFFCHLGDEAPEFPWNINDFPRNAYNVPDVYREWRMDNGLMVMCSMSPSPTRSENDN